MIKEKFFTTEQVANILQVHPFTILKYIREGKLKGIKLGRVYRIQESDIESFLEECTTKVKSKKVKEESNETVKTEKKTETKKKEHYKIDKDNPDNQSHYYVI